MGDIAKNGRCPHVMLRVPGRIGSKIKGKLQEKIPGERVVRRGQLATVS